MNKNTSLAERLSIIDPLLRNQVRTRMIISDNIHKLMINNGYDHNILAEKINKDLSTIAKWLNGTNNFTVNTLVEIALFFKVDVSTLFIKN